MSWARGYRKTKSIFHVIFIYYSNDENEEKIFVILVIIK